MPDLFDPNQVIANFMTQNLTLLLEAFQNRTKKFIDNIRARIDSTYRKYLTQMFEKYSKVKSFFVRAEPVFLYSFYIPLSLKTRTADIEMPDIIKISNISKNIIITGLAGTGKSMMLRHLLLSSLTNNYKVPIFIELRTLNQNSEVTIMDAIFDVLSAFKLTEDHEFSERALRLGHFAVFFDGIDEVSKIKRQTISNQIQNFAKHYDKCMIIVSSRPDNEFGGWANFTIMQMAPLNLQQACSLIEKLEYDPDIKSKFDTALKNGLFKSHVSFLSNPLLLSIMLLTYGQSADIPMKLNVFYNQAYEALYQRHDAFKGGYQRDRKSGLDIQDFARMFSAFSLQTYDKRMFQFS